MTDKKLNKNQLRTKETRELLLQSAEKIFIRDGYEGAELGEIAALAGRTKGAIYAQFKSKEDIFLALVAQHRARYRAQMEDMLATSKSVEENIAALRKLYLKMAEDQAWGLLMLEFKLYAMRHPESKVKLKSYFDMVMPDEEKLTKLLGIPLNGKEGLSRRVAVLTLQPILSALLVEARFMPTLLDDDVLRKVVTRIFNALLQSHEKAKR